MQQNIDELFDSALQSLNLGNPKEALKKFSKVLELEPNHQKALVKIGNVLGKLGKYQQAIPYYDKALQNDAGDLLALINKGLALHYLEKYSQAIEQYDTALLQRPDSTTILYNKASSLIRINRIDEGLEILKEIIKIDFSYKTKAKHDIDFQKIKHLNEFKKIIL